MSDTGTDEVQGREGGRIGGINLSNLAYNAVSEMIRPPPPARGRGDR